MALLVAGSIVPDRPVPAQQPDARGLALSQAEAAQAPPAQPQTTAGDGGFGIRSPDSVFDGDADGPRPAENALAFRTQIDF